MGHVYGNSSSFALHLYDIQAMDTTDFEMEPGEDLGAEHELIRRRYDISVRRREAQQTTVNSRRFHRRLPTHDPRGPPRPPRLQLHPHGLPRRSGRGPLRQRQIHSEAASTLAIYAELQGEMDLTLPLAHTLTHVILHQLSEQSWFCDSFTRSIAFYAHCDADTPIRPYRSEGVFFLHMSEDCEELVQVGVCGYCSLE